MTLSGTCIKLFWPMLLGKWKTDRSLLICAGYLAFSGLLTALTIVGARAERRSFLYYPSRWVFHSRLAKMKAPADNQGGEEGGGNIGGASLAVLPLDIKRYIVKEGDTFSAIAERFGMDLDTIASLNRQWGSGVHLVRVGEQIRIPNQDGIFIPINKSFERLCGEKNVPPEVVLQVNRIERRDLRPGIELFFPGVQHTGIERSVITGTAFLRPVAGWTSSLYGYRRDPFTEAVQFHRGIDIAAPLGAPVHAALDGKVVTVDWDPVLGKYVVIRHQIGYSSVYGHLQQVYVHSGSAVARGQRIGLVGSSGKSTGPHLHFEVRKNGVPINTTGLLSSKR